MGNILAVAFELLAKCDDRNKVRRIEHTGLERVAAVRLFERQSCGKGTGAKTIGWSGSARFRKREYAANALKSGSRRRARADDNSGHAWHRQTPIPGRHYPRRI